MMLIQQSWNLWRLGGFGDFRQKKTPKHTWLCAGIATVR